jgi:polygalacturonase
MSRVAKKTCAAALTLLVCCANCASDKGAAAAASAIAGASAATAGKNVAAGGTGVGQAGRVAPGLDGGFAAGREAAGERAEIAGGGGGESGSRVSGSAGNAAAGRAAAGGSGSSGTPSVIGTAGSGTGTPGRCGAGDPKLPPEPTLPTACATIEATQTVAAGAVPDEKSLDTGALQAALNACVAGQAVKLVASGANNAFVTGPLTVPTGVTLWVDAGTTLFGTRDPSIYGSTQALISVSGANSGIVGDGIIDGQGGEPQVGQSQSFWDANAGSAGNSPALIQVRGATNFTLYRITLHNSPKFHVKLGANGFVVWGVTVKAPSKATNSQGKALTASGAHNTDGIDPGEAASNGFIVCSKISVGDDHIAIKGTNGVDHLTIAHNHFGAGHGMSIGSEFQGGVSNVDVYDLSIDGTNTGLTNGSSNGIRIKSDPSRGGVVSDVTYRDICVRQLWNPIILTPKYSTATGSSIPQYKNILIQDFHALRGSATPKVTLDGYSADYLNGVTLDNVIVDGIAPSSVSASYTNLTLGPGNVNFMPSGTQVTVTNKISGTSAPNACDGKWVTF